MFNEKSQRSSIWPFAFIPLIFLLIGFLFCSVVVLALIPLYISTKEFDVERSTTKYTDLWALRFSTDLNPNPNDILQAKYDENLAKMMDVTMDLQAGTALVERATFNMIRLDLTSVSGKRALPTSGVLCEFNVYLRLKHPTQCSNSTNCQRIFRELSLLKCKNAKPRYVTLNLKDGRTINTVLNLEQLTENVILSTNENRLQPFIDRLLTKLREIEMDSILYWNLVANEANAYDYDKTLTSVPDQPGPLRHSRALAIIHGAMYEVFNNLQQQPIDSLTAEQRSLHTKTAIMEAAYKTLTNLYPSQKSIFDAVRSDFLRRVNPSNNQPDIVQRGISIGQTAGTSLINRRENDGSRTTATYRPKSERGYHQVDPLHPKQGFLAPKWGEVTPFILRSGSQLRLPTSIGLDSVSRLAYLNSPKFRSDYDEVKAWGAKVTPNRTADQEEYSIFWAYDGAPKIGLPPRLYNQVVRVIALQQRNTLEQNARLFAMVNYAMADAGIACWDAKYAFELWRPIVAIRNGTQSIPADPTWEPLGAPASGLGTDFTPNFPSYSSGHAAFGSSMFEVVRLFYGRDNIAFSFQSDEFNGKTIDSRTGLPRPVRTRSYQSLSQAEDENTLARIYLGIHWRIDQDDGQELGRQVGRYVFYNFK